MAPEGRGRLPVNNSIPMYMRAALIVIRGYWLLISGFWISRTRNWEKDIVGGTRGAGGRGCWMNMIKIIKCNCPLD